MCAQCLAGSRGSRSIIIQNVFLSHFSLKVILKWAGLFRFIVIGVHWYYHACFGRFIFQHIQKSAEKLSRYMLWCFGEWNIQVLFWIPCFMQLNMCKWPQLHNIPLCLDWLSKVWVFIFCHYTIFNSVSIHSQKYSSFDDPLPPRQELCGMDFSVKA